VKNLSVDLNEPLSDSQIFAVTTVSIDLLAILIKMKVKQKKGKLDRRMPEVRSKCWHHLKQTKKKERKELAQNIK